ncbi:MAG: hypothetical protein HZB19_16455 [Chloroflexi bacterium]|nr:hypothetical protein [Chloroflexota bacterium]
MGKRILLIDDDTDLGKLIQAVLEPMDLKVYQAFNGLEGLMTGDYPQVRIRHSKPQNQSILPRISLIHTDF